MPSLFESSAEEALLTEFKGFRDEVLGLKATDKGFAYLVAQHDSIHRRLAQFARDAGDPAVLATLLKQRALVLNEIAAYLMEIEEDEEIVERRG